MGERRAPGRLFNALAVACLFLKAGFLLWWCTAAGGCSLVGGATTGGTIQPPLAGASIEGGGAARRVGEPRRGAPPKAQAGAVGDGAEGRRPGG